MNRSKFFLIFLWVCMVIIARGQTHPDHNHRLGEECLKCRATELNEEAAQKEAVYVQSHRLKTAKVRAVKTMPPDDFEYVIPVV